MDSRLMKPPFTTIGSSNDMWKKSADLHCSWDIATEIPQRDVLPHQIQFQERGNSNSCSTHQLMLKVIPEDVDVLHRQKAESL